VHRGGKGNGKDVLLTKVKKLGKWEFDFISVAANIILRRQQAIL
jgi:hypothetical protein